MKECYVSRQFRGKSLKMIETINGVIDEYTAQGYRLTLRQLYYQLVARDYIPNTPTSYKNIGSLINDARLAGMIDWDAVTDRTRYIRQQSHFDNPADVIRAAAYSYKLDRWETQPNYCEVWVEKDALIDIVQQAANAWDVPCFSCRGYVSQSEMYGAAQRFIAQSGRNGCYIIHLGDHDPSGVDMTRDIIDRMKLFGANVEVKRIALNMEQIAAFNPPPNPAKETDKRFAGYIQKYGDTSWELDALEPQVLTQLITSEIMKLIDIGKYNAVVQREQTEKNNLDYLSWAMGENYTEVLATLKQRY